MSQEKVALIVTVTVNEQTWEDYLGREYDAEDVSAYVALQIETSGAVVAGALEPEVNVRFRRNPK